MREHPERAAMASIFRFGPTVQRSQLALDSVATLVEAAMKALKSEFGSSDILRLTMCFQAELFVSWRHYDDGEDEGRGIARKS